MEPYRVDVGDILHDLGASVAVEADVSIDAIEFGDITFDPAGPVKLDVNLTNTGTGVVAQGHALIDLRTDCSRCLESFVLHVKGSVEGLYTTPQHAEGLPEDQEWEPLTDDSVDLMPAVLAAIRVELPLAPLHAEDCMGICPTCGCDLNQGACGCTPDTSTEGPFGVLKSLLEDADTPE